MAIALMSFPPKACPHCGHQKQMSTGNREDFYAGAACTCPSCGLHYAYAPAEKIRLLAAEVGDMGRYVEAGCAD